MKRFGSIGTAVGAALAALVLAQAAQAAGDAPTGAVGGKRSPAAGVLQLDILARAGSAQLDTATVEVDGAPVSQGALCSGTEPCDLGRVTFIVTALSTRTLIFRFADAGGRRLDVKIKVKVARR